MSYQKYAAELLGTFTLTLMVFLSLTSGFLIPTPVVAGLVVGLFVYTIGPISGTHLNPAVTIALFSIRKISLTDAICYIVAQLAGALLALLASSQHGPGFMPAVLAANTPSVGLAEAMGAFVLVFGIASVVY